MQKRAGVLILCSLVLASSILPSYAVVTIGKDKNQKEAAYVLKVKKEDAKTKYERRVYNRNPNGYMTVEEYEKLSAPVDLTNQEVKIPEVQTPSDMVYVPHPTYSISRYNNPPGSPEISIPSTIYKTRQFNGQGVVSPNFSVMVYPSVYYYPNSDSTACDLFVIPLDSAKTKLERIMTAHVSLRMPNPIMTTDTDNANNGTFTTLTPIDFSKSGTKLLVKEKIGNTDDGIWQTKIAVYDFATGTSYDLVEIREAISYYWQEHNGLNLDDKRWDIYPLGFSITEPDRVLVEAYAYTGGVPVNLGIWSIDSHGEQSRLVSLNKADVQISENGFKLVQDGVEAPIILKAEQAHKKYVEKQNAKKAKKADAAVVKSMTKDYKKEVQTLQNDYKFDAKEYRIRQKYTTSTDGYNEGYEKYKTERSKQLENEIKKDEASIQKRMDKIQKLQDKMKQYDEAIQTIDKTPYGEPAVLPSTK